MSETAFSVTPAGVGELLQGGDNFVPPARLLGGLTEAQAMATPPASPYSIAQVVAHMHFWQQREIDKACGDAPPRPVHLDDTFTPPAPGAWSRLVSDFLSGLDRVAALAAERGGQGDPDRSDATLAYTLADNVALHNAYHWGQVALLRQAQGFWPPEGGDDSW